MRKIIYFLALMCLMPIYMLAQTEVSMPSNDGQERTVNVSTPVTFYDAGGETGDIPTYKTTGITTFVPNIGEKIQIIFETIDLQGSSMIVLFDGAKPLNSYYDDWTYEYSIPSSGRKISLSGTRTNDTISSDSNDGKLTVCFQNANGTGAGWKATVTSIPRPPLPANEVRIGVTPSPYTVGNTPINFYDDGGAAGKITENFNGSITFTPEDPAKRIKIDFTDVNIFYTSSAVSINNQDVLKVYNGSEATSANLITTLTTQPTVVKSTASDGSLTVTLKSTTGVPADGFKAVVTQFAATNMSFNGTQLTQDTLKTVCAGDQDQVIMVLNLKTLNALDPLTADKFIFNTNGTFANIEKAKLYYTGTDSTFSTSAKVGEVSVISDDFEILLATAQTLAEGNNYFWLTYDIKDNAIQGESVDAGCSKVVVSANDHNIDAASVQPQGNRTIKNEYISTIGTYQRTIYGTWTFTHTPQSQYSSKYKAEEGDQIVTFLPGTAGTVVEIDFMDFDVRYASNSYQVKAKFEIYSGVGTSGVKLWEVDASNKSTGPGRIIRSNSADGAITVVFNANTNMSYYNADGWHAEVREYIPQPMQLVSTDVFQNNTDIITPADINQEIIGIKINTSGSITPLPVNELTINLKGSESEISKVNIFSTGNSNIFDSTNKIAEMGITNQTSVTIAPTATFNLAEGDNYLWIAYDMNTSIQSEQSIDASVTNIKINNVDVVPTNNDPDGARITKNIYLFQGDTNIVNVASPLLFYDDGGPDNNYSKEVKGVVTFVPRAGEAIKFIFRSINTRYNDHFYVYNGGLDGEELADLSGTSLHGDKLPTPIISSAADGSLTVKFEPRYSYNDGWEIEVLSVVPAPLSVASVTTSVASMDTVFRGSQSEKMLKVEVEVVGDVGTLNLNSFGFTVEGTTNIADISGAHLYYTGIKDVFSPIEEYNGTVTTSAPFTFTGTTSINKVGTYKFWLAYDIAPSATVNNVVEAKLASIEHNGNPISFTTDDLASRTIRSGFSGTYTIGASSSANYATFAQAINAMKNGIDGQVVFEVENGTYTESVKLPHVPGASAQNTITIKSQSGDYADVIIEQNGYPSSGDAVFTVNGTDFLILEGMSFKTNKTGYDAVILVKNTSQHVTVKNCLVQAPRSISYSSGDISAVQVKGENEAYQNCDYFTLENSTIIGGYAGAYLSGTGYVALPKQRGARISGNTFSDQGFMSIYSMKEANCVIENNTIVLGGNVDYSIKGIDASLMGNIIIRNNKIRVDSTLTGSSSSLYLRQVGENSVDFSFDRNRIYNNQIVIDNVNNNEQQKAIDCTDALINTDIVYNSVNILNSDTIMSNVALYVSGVPVDMHVENNLFQNNAWGYTYKIKKANAFAGMTFSNNALYTSNPNVFAHSGDNQVATFNDWVALSGETNSFVEQAQFLSNTSLELTAVGNLQNATPLTYVTVDINGTARNLTTPTIGAYEHVVAQIPEFVENYPVIRNITYNSAKARVKVTENGKIFFMVKLASEAAPTEAEILANDSSSVVKNVELDLDLNNLNSSTEYKVYFVLQSDNNAQSEVLESSLFTTSFRPTEVSTFEEVTVATGDFTDATADFHGFVVETITDGVGTDNQKAAKVVGDTAVVVINNSTEGLLLNGFNFKSDADVELIVKKVDNQVGTLSLRATNGKWVFVSLKSFYEITSVLLIGSGNIMIDNFSGEPQPISISLADTTVNENTTITMVGDVNGGALPYTYAWTNAHQDTISTTDSLTITPTNTGVVKLTVTDGWGNTQSVESVVTVLGTSKVATFDDLYLAPESHLWEDADNDLFYSGSYSFSTTINTSMSSWSGFAYSNQTGTSFTSSDWLDNQFNSLVGHGVNNSDNYAVAYVFGGHTEVNVENDSQGDNISGFYITNNAWLKHVSENGTGMNSTGQQDANTPFGEGDWYKIIAQGDNGNTAEFYLADYRSSNSANHYIVDSWEWFDLSSLGKVRKVTFHAEGSRNNNLGSTIPAYFCMDDFGGERRIDVVDTINIEVEEQLSINLGNIAIGDSVAGADIVYSIIDSIDNSLATTVINGNMLDVTGLQEGEGEIVVSKTIQGKTVFIRLHFVVSPSSTTGVINVTDEAITVYPNPATTEFRISTSGRVEIFTQSGYRVYSQPYYQANTPISTSGYSKGAYIVIINGYSVKLIVR